MKRSAMVWGGLGTLLVLAVGGFAGCGSFGAKECDNGNCDTADGCAGGDGSSNEGGPIADGGDKPIEGGSTVDAPPGCDLKTAPTSAACVSDATGIFVDSAGSDNNMGTKAKPLATIGKAITLANAQNSVIFVCAGTYKEHVVLDKGVELYGGFTCGTWAAGTSPVVVAPTDVGYALDVKSVTTSFAAGGPVRIQNIEFDAPDGTAASVNSIAVRSFKSSIQFTKVKFIGGTGFDGKPGAAGETGTISNLAMVTNANGYPAPDLATAGPPKTCTCSSGGSSTGGLGGVMDQGGQKGKPALPEFPTGLTPPHDGVGGTGDGTPVTALGHPGADATDGADAPTLTVGGTLAGDSWQPAAAADGTAGTPGQGGGGGGGGTTGPAGGGACGGCGGSAGTGGGGAGGGIGLLSLDSTNSLIACSVAAGKGGKGGAGGARGSGATGGSGSNGLGNGASSGAGGKGGAGGAGGGGAGGVSVGIMFRTSKVSHGADSAISTVDTTNNRGLGGVNGLNDGVDGARSDDLQVQ
jgi:hypothetical protein